MKLIERIFLILWKMFWIFVKYPMDIDNGRYHKYHSKNAIFS